VTEPTTEAGLAPSEGLLRMIADWLSRPAEVGSIRDSLRLLVAKETILVLEAEAIAAERARLREAVEGLHDAICAFCNGNGLFDSAAVLALLEPQP